MSLYKYLEYFFNIPINGTYLLSLMSLCCWVDIITKPIVLPVNMIFYREINEVIFTFSGFKLLSPKNLFCVSVSGFSETLIYFLRLFGLIGGRLYLEVIVSFFSCLFYFLKDFCLDF